MTEQQWAESATLSTMLWFLADQKGHSRHINLWIVACCRQVEHLVDSLEIQKAIDAAERYAEEAIQRTTMQTWIRRARRARRELSPELPTEKKQACEAVSKALWYLVSYPNGYNPTKIAQALVTEARHTGPWGLVKSPDLLKPIERRLVDLLRDMVGNPFQPRPVGNPAWLEANGGLAGRLANSIYEEKRFAEVPILADALEDAGCTEKVILEHLRGPGPHARGCWALNVVLGK
jgi:hypothetical protein